MITVQLQPVWVERIAQTSVIATIHLTQGTDNYIANKKILTQEPDTIIKQLPQRYLRDWTLVNF